MHHGEFHCVKYLQQTDIILFPILGALNNVKNSIINKRNTWKQLKSKMYQSRKLDLNIFFVILTYLIVKDTMIKNQRSHWQKYKTNTFYTQRKTQHNYKQITEHKVTDLQWVEPQCLVCELTSCVNCGPEIVWKKLKHITLAL